MVDVDWAVGSYEEGSNNSLPCPVLETQLCWCQAALSTVAGSHIQNNRQLQHTHSSAFVATALTRLHHNTRTARDKPHIHPHESSMKLSFNSYKWTLLRLFYLCLCLVFNIFYIVLICEQDSRHALNQSCELCPEWWEMWPWGLLRHFCVSFHLISLVWAVAFSVTSLRLQIHV